MNKRSEAATQPVTKNGDIVDIVLTGGTGVSKHQYRLVPTKTNLSTTPMDLGPDSPLYAKLIGKKLGDEFTHSEKSKCKVLAVQHPRNKK